jgi:hypothetical protein
MADIGAGAAVGAFADVEPEGAFTDVAGEDVSGALAAPNSAKVF